MAEEKEEVLEGKDADIKKAVLVGDFAKAGQSVTQSVRQTDRQTACLLI